MLCEICKQNQATIHIQELNKGEKSALHICESCATKKGLGSMNLQGINIAEILYKFSASTEEFLPITANNTTSPNISDNKTIINTICPKCKWKISKFQQTGRLGCENCYQTFFEVLSETLNSMHKGNIHTGKYPNLQESGEGSLMLDILNLQKQLDEHVKREEYENAAQLRDQINKLKKETIPEINE
jgi:protein arginine kinase activator